MTGKEVVKPDGEYIKVEMTIEKVFDGSSMRYEVTGGNFLHLSEKFKKVLREDWDIDVDEYTQYIRLAVGEEDILYPDED